MWTLRIIFRNDFVVVVTSRALMWAGAGLAALLLLAAFVQVLHESIERGERLRMSDWASTAPPARATVVALQRPNSAIIRAAR